MRALILILALAIVGLAVSIVHYVGTRPDFVTRVGEPFLVGLLLHDAQPGETAVYREKTSLRLVEYRVEAAPKLPPMVTPYKRIRRTLKDPRGTPFGDSPSGVAYKHRLTEHGWFPLIAPEAPDALDRVWIIRSIRTDTLSPDPLDRRSKERKCWRVDLIDPALPEGSDTVVAWFDYAVPVYGLLKWKRAGETWEYEVP